MKAPPARKPKIRSADQASRLLRKNLPPLSVLDKLAQDVEFEPYTKHKLEPARFNLCQYTGKKMDCTYCDYDAGFLPKYVLSIPSWLQQGIKAGLIGEEDTAFNEPTLIWAIGYDGWIFEARITYPGKTIYHGYPILSNDPTGGIIIKRFSSWVALNQAENLQCSLDACQRRYS